MANEIQFSGATGQIHYALVFNGTGSVYDGTAFVTPVAANWDSYDVALTEISGSGLFRADFPVVAAAVYNVEVRWQAAATAAPTDEIVGAGQMHWGGTAEAGIRGILSDQVAPTDVSGSAVLRDSYANMFRAVFDRFFEQVTQTPTYQTVFNNSGGTIAYMPVSDDGTTATKGEA